MLSNTVKDFPVVVVVGPTKRCCKAGASLIVAVDSLVNTPPQHVNKTVKSFPACCGPFGAG